MRGLGWMVILVNRMFIAKGSLSTDGQARSRRAWKPFGSDRTVLIPPNFFKQNPHHTVPRLAPLPLLTRTHPKNSHSPQKTLDGTGIL